MIWLNFTFKNFTLDSTCFHQISFDTTNIFYIEQNAWVRWSKFTKDVYNLPEKWTALTKHAWHQDHKFNFDEVKIIDRSDNYKKRMILEMTHKTVNPHAVNQRADIENLSVFYLPLLNDKLYSRQKNFFYLLST